MITLVDVLMEEKRLVVFAYMLCMREGWRFGLAFAKGCLWSLQHLAVKFDVDSFVVDYEI